MTHDEAIKTIKEALYDGHPCMIENLFLDALAALDSLAAKPSEDVRELVETIRGDSAWSPGMMTKDQTAALITAHDDAIRRECADRAIEYIATGNYGSDTGLRSAITGKEPTKC